MKGKLLVNCLELLCLIVLTEQYKDPHYIDGRSVMVHMFEWKFKDIAEECERFLGPYGYGGIQLSPITENAVIGIRPWWERYQVVSYKFETRSGNEKELADMIRRCNQAGVRVFVDVILNHMTGNNGESIVGTAGTKANPSIKSFPGVPYSDEHFHPTCALNDFNDLYQLKNCELVGLRDLNQTQEYVRDKMVDLLNRMIDLGVAGFRFDASKHIYVSDFEAILNRVKNLNTNYNFPPNARPFAVHEVSDYGNEVVHREEYFGIGTVTEFRFGNFLTMTFRGDTPLKNLINFGTDWGLMKGEDGLVFVDNHDTQRGGYILTHKDSKKYKMAVAFMLAHPHSKLPRVMSSFSFVSSDDPPPQDSNHNITSPIINPDDSCGGGWICEHRWRQIYNMVQFKNVVGDAPLINWWDNGWNQIAFCRGNKGFVAFTKKDDLKQNLQTCLPSGTYCDVISGKLLNGRCTGKTVNVSDGGMAYVEILQWEMDGVLALHIEARI